MNRYVVTLEETVRTEYVVWAAGPEEAVRDVRGGAYEDVRPVLHVHDEVINVAIEQDAVA